MCYIHTYTFFILFQPFRGGKKHKVTADIRSEMFNINSVHFFDIMIASSWKPILCSNCDKCSATYYYCYYIHYTSYIPATWRCSYAHDHTLSAIPCHYVHVYCVCVLHAQYMCIVTTVHLHRHKSEKPFMKIEGEWDNILTAKDRSGVSDLVSHKVSHMMCVADFIYKLCNVLTCEWKQFHTLALSCTLASSLDY